MPKSENTLVIAEKPSVAKDIARVIGAHRSHASYLEGNGYTVSWALGHLVTLPEPHLIDPQWKKWRKETLPMVPKRWPLTVIEKTASQFQVLESLFRSCKEIICATDAGREGELIFRYIYEAIGVQKPVKRLWISSLTDEAIRRGFQNLRESSAYDPLAHAARGRSCADWLVGMNFSRAYALTYGEQFFVGRVQTPTLALIVKRDLEIRDFKPEDYFDLTAVFSSSPTTQETYRGHYLGEAREVKSPDSVREKKLPPNRSLVDGIIERIQQGDREGNSKIRSIHSKDIPQPPPLLYDLTELQRHANRLFGYSASKTLEVAQSLYERHKLISYPRTDSRALSKSVAENLPAVVSAIRHPYEEWIKKETGNQPLGLRFVNDAEVTDHHAIIPTPHSVKKSALSDEEYRIYDLVCRRLLSAWQGDYITSVTTLITEVESTDSNSHDSFKDLFRTIGVAVHQMGWKALDLTQSEEITLPSGLKSKQSVYLRDVQAQLKQTKPPPHLTDAALLNAMETAGKSLEDKELATVMRDSGLGTPATRANIIETLLVRNYVERKGKSLRATDLGIRLIETVDSFVKSPELTAKWERDLIQIQNGKELLQTFMRSLEAEIREKVKQVIAQGPVSLTRTVALNRAPVGEDRMLALLKEKFGFSSFRPHQEEVCKKVLEGRDVLLVMPTGAGKSLCYQLPGLARGGTTLVISPLLALIEDQVLKLKQQGIVAERIHSGRKREDSRAVCIDYLSGKLDFLFIAPERLSVPGFLDLLKRRPPTLIAIDEAHCISHWGHDFRPDYRLLGERLHEFRPCPVIALTATATSIVQDDIVEQLNLTQEVRLIHGFRRTNIAIQVAKMNPSARPHAIQTLLKEKDRLPAIVYAPTRKVAESLCSELKGIFRRVEAYHAGLTPTAREQCQTLFLEGKLDIVVATIAFGMGVDKADIRTVIHAALPGSIEAYYQEIGRAGRDGLPSRAILLHSYSDQRTHQFFFDRDYPEISVLKKIYDSLPEGNSQTSSTLTKEGLQLKHLKQHGIHPDVFEKALEKLFIHQGIVPQGIAGAPEPTLCKGAKTWETNYRDQWNHRVNQLKEVSTFAESNECRMLSLVEHFGDQKDSGNPCGICDTCAPNSAHTLSDKRPLSKKEQRVAIEVLSILEGHRYLAAGKVFDSLSPGKDKVKRQEFEEVLTCLAKAQWIEIEHDEFEKDGKIIAYRKISLTWKGGKVTPDEVEKLELKNVSGSSSKFKKKPSPLKSKVAGKSKTRRGAPRTRKKSRQSPRPLAVELD